MTDMTPQTPHKGPTRVDKHNQLVDNEIKKVLDDLEIVSSHSTIILVELCLLLLKDFRTVASRHGMLINM